MANDNHKMQSWQIFNAARKHLGVGRVVAIFGKKNARSAYTWAQDPRYTEDRCKDPVEALHHMLSELDTFGRSDVCRATIDYLRSAFEEVEPGPVGELRPTIMEELLCDYKAVAALQAAVESCEQIDIVEVLTEAAKEEIDRTYAKYIKGCK